jgi:AhpD family alkylhydroperoxidase
MTHLSQHSNEMGATTTAKTPAPNQPRIKNPASLLPGAMQGIQTLMAAVYKGGVPASTLELCHLRASQINGCHLCIESGQMQAKSKGETDERLKAVANWQGSELFTDAERAALALSESVTRIADSEDPVPNAIWQQATRYYDGRALAALVLMISVTNTFNRLNVSTRQVAAEWG